VAEVCRNAYLYSAVYTETVDLAYIKSERVSVSAAALATFIDYADDCRFMRDQEFCCSTAENERSRAEINELIEALDQRDA
jgi:hypothetical protein